MAIVNLTKNTWVATRVEKADTFMSRLSGLLGRRGLGPEDSLWIVPCRGIHTIGMKFPIDVVFMNRENRVIGMASRLRPYGATRVYLTAHSALELPEGSIEKSFTAIGDQLDISLGADQTDYVVSVVPGGA